MLTVKDAFVPLRVACGVIRTLPPLKQAPARAKAWRFTWRARICSVPVLRLPSYERSSYPNESCNRPMGNFPCDIWFLCVCVCDGNSHLTQPVFFIFVIIILT